MSRSINLKLAYRNFVETCKSPITRKSYLMSLYHFMDYLKIGHDQYDKLLNKDPKIVQNDVCDFIMFMRKEGSSSAAVSLYVAALCKFYNMNDRY